MAHSRVMRQTLDHLSSAKTGNTTVIVLSVNNCWRPRTTIKKPTL